MLDFPHINNASDLVTTRAEVRAGFVAMALEKNRRSVPFVEEARALKVLAATARKPTELLEVKGIRPALLTASGLSDKALNHLEDEDKDEAIRGLIEQFLDPAGDDFVDELVYRFLLIKGDSLGGSMRNVAGYLAEQIFKRSVIAALNVRKIDFVWLSKNSKKWLNGDKLGTDVEDVVGLHWKQNGLRTLVFNKTVQFIKKNIDICLISSSPDEWADAMKVASNYVALGELKGGIDPAGADEHWKTARSALDRITTGFSKEGCEIETFFIGAAIESAMAIEIWEWLQSGKLHNAGNLTDKKHIASVCGWLVEI